MSKLTYVYWVHLPDHHIKTDGYVGISIEPAQRWKNHKKQSTNCSHFKNAIDKYKDQLIWEIIYEGPEEGASQIEEYFRPEPGIGWNINQGGRIATMLNRKHSEKTKQKMSKAGKGRKKSEEHKAKIGKANKGKAGFPGASNPRARKVQCIETGEIFETVKDAAIWINRNSTAILAHLSGRTSHSGGYTWKYLS
ncbi:MAG: hypothetical protein BV457_05875 [Thermoplasmata archaeon M9B1D]|nr:MAG: hypothetical protein BV457_05875 [Thermoplasmata archaeon M9B1D]PNX51235.1 MAG: hypothetical protein BV456_04010 [Thermoplasmata archaeon M8B2D]